MLLSSVDTHGRKDSVTAGITQEIYATAKASKEFGANVKRVIPELANVQSRLED